MTKTPTNKSSAKLLNSYKRRLGLALVSMLLLAPVAAQADTDWKVYPGTICQAGNNVRQLNYDAFGGACNKSSTKKVVVHCPVVRDFGKSRFPTHVKHVGRSGDPDTPLRCVLRSLKTGAVDSGSQMQAGSVPLVDIPSGQTRTIRERESTFSTGRPRGIADYGAYVLTCDLPASKFTDDNGPVESCLYNYSIREWDGD